MSRLTLPLFTDRLKRLVAEHVRDTKIATNQIGDDAMHANAYGGSRMELAIYEEIYRRFRALMVVILAELHTSKSRLDRLKAEQTALSILREAASSFADMATYESPPPWPSRRNAMADRKPEFDAFLEVSWRDYRAGLLFPPAAAGLPWFQRPIGLVLIGLAVAALTGLFALALELLKPA